MINFVTESGRWILGRWCDEWAKLIPNSTVSDRADKERVNIYVNYALWNGMRTKKDICYFTHRELTDQNLQEKFDKTAKDCDWCFAQCQITANKLPKDKTTIVEPGVGASFVKRNIVIGVPVKEQAFDRKRLSWARRLRDIKGIEVKFANGDVKYEDMPYWYETVDYVLITSDNEGGPMGVLEAVARGKPLIVPVDVGWCNNYNALRFRTYEELEGIVKKLVYPRDMWKVSADQIVKLVNQLI